MRTVLLLACASAALAACASPTSLAAPNGPWHYAKQVTNCLRFGGYRPEDTRSTVVLEDAFRESLISKLPAGSLPSPQCWYAKPDGSLLLLAGDFCRDPHWVTFVRDRDEWQVAKVEQPIMSCHPRARS